MLLSIINLGHDDVKIIKKHTLAYLTPAQYDYFSETNQEIETSQNILAAPSGTKVEILPGIPSHSKMIFPGYNTPVRNVLL